MAEWRPIETAPKDGMVLVWGPLEEVAIAWQDRGHWRTGDGGFWSPIITPTHWMPLPAPPEPETDD